MEKNLLIQNLKSKAGVDNLSDRTYDEVATLFLSQFADDEKVTEETYSIPLQMLKTMSGQLRHDVADGISRGKSQWETDVGIQGSVGERPSYQRTTKADSTTARKDYGGTDC